MRALHIIVGIVSATLVGQVAQAQEMVLIPGGEFEMGDSFDEAGPDELPVHTVYLSPYYIETYEVTNQQYADALNWAYAQGGLITVTSGVVYQAGSGTSYPYCDTTTSSSYSRITWNGSTFGITSGKEDHPMVRVSWYGSVAYANWRSGMEGKPLCYDLPTWTCNFGVAGYRLPTEAEWEKAARGGTPGHRFPWSDQDTIQHARANYYSYWPDGAPYYPYDTSPTEGYHPLWGVSPYPYTSPVGFFTGALQYKADWGWPGAPTSYQTTNSVNDYGLYDMAGNVWEWCHDWGSSSYYSSSPPSNPTGPASGTYRVLRGGGWYNVAYYCRCAYREISTPGYRYHDYGFRCALGTPEGSQPPEMVFVPGGSFEMGDSFGEGDSDELPVHTVYLSPYYIDKYEVTNAQYAAGLNWAWAQGGLIDVIDGMVYKYDSGTSYFYSSTTSGDSGYPHYAEFSRITWNGSTFGVVAGKQDHPMLLVSWYGSVAYCNWRSAMAGNPLCYDLSTWTCNFGVDGYRLPTEAEWEKAAGWDPTQQRHFRFGEHTDGCGYDCLDGQRANYWTSGDPYEVSPLPYPTPVGFYNGELHYKADFGWPSSETTYQTQDAQSYYGCYDMSGNVWEWCNDWYDSGYYDDYPHDGWPPNPTGPGSGTGRVMRGSAWTDDPSDCRSANRFGCMPDSHNIRWGFRCALGTLGGGAPPVADAGGPYSGVVGVAITFDASNSYDPDGEIVGYRWDWTNDGDWDTDWLADPVTTHAYAAEFHGKVRLQVKDDDDATDTDKADVHVVAVGGPDLAILDGDLSIPAYMVENSVYRIEATVRNIGSESAQYNFDVRFLAWGPDDSAWTTLETLGIFELGPGESALVGTWFVPDEAGQYQIKVVVDCNDEIAEGNEDNKELVRPATALATIDIDPSAKYTWQYEQLHLEAYVYNNYAGEPITGPPGWVTWRLFDSDGMVVPGYGEHIEFTFDSGDNVWEWDGEVSDLTTGETYTVKVYYGFGYETPIDFFKESGIAWVQGYVYDDDGVGIDNATVEFNAFHPLGPDYGTTTGSDGFYSFDGIEAWVYAGHASCNPPECSAGPLRPSVRPLIAKSDQTTEVDFVLYVDAEIEFGRMLDRLRSGCKEAMSDLADDLQEMNDDYVDLADDGLEKIALGILDIAASIMLGVGGMSPGAGAATLAEGSTLEFGETLVQVLMQAETRIGIIATEFEMLIHAGSDGLFAALVAVDQGSANVKADSFYVQAESTIDQMRDEFLGQVPPVVHADFDFDRAHRVVGYVADELDPDQAYCES